MSYTKTWNDSVSSKATQTMESLASGSSNWVVNSYPTTSTLQLPQTKTGQSVPNWRELIKEGKLAASPYSVSFSRISSLESGSVAIWYQNPGVSQSRERFSGVFSAPALPTVPSMPDEVSNKALSRILGKIRDQVEHANVLPALGELRSTVSQFGAPASAILSLSNRHINRLELAARGLKGSTAFKRIKWHRIVASTYLEYTFGLAPLIEDTKKVAEALARWKAEEERDLPKPTSEYLRASYDSKTGSNTVGSAQWMSPASNLSYRLHNTDKTDFGVRYWVKLKHSLQAEFGSNDRLLQLLGFGNPLNFIPTIWEVLPWSWLADYFLNIQQIIEAGVTDTSNIEWIVRSSRIKQVRDHVTIPGKRDLAGGWAPTSWIEQGKHLGRWRTERTTFSRSLPTSLGLPIPVVNYPTSGKKLANMTAALFARRSHANSLWLF